MDPQELVERFPRLYHMAQDGSWPQIQRLGLLSTAALLDAYGIGPARRDTILAQRRPTRVLIEHPTFGTAVVRDQIPMNDAVLARILDDGLRPADWYRILNNHVFFWPSESRLMRLLAARAYRNETHTVLTVDTRLLMHQVGPQIRLSPINSGSTIFDARPRGLSTLASVETYPYDEWRRKRGPRNAIAEVAVVEGIREIYAVVLQVDRRQRDTVVEQLYAAPDLDGG